MTDERIVSYLLGELPEEESERFDEEFMAAGHLAEEIRLVEDDLVDAYLLGELTHEQRRHFEQNYLTDARKERVARAAALLRHVNTLAAEQTPDPKPAGPTWLKSFVVFAGGRSWAPRAGLALALVAVVAGALWLIRSRTTSPKDFATLTLVASTDSNRAEGARARRIRLTPSVGALKLYLKLANSSATAARYRVDLLSEEGETNPVAVTGQDAESISVEIPAAQLARGQYALRLYAIRPDGAEQRVNGLYYFIVE